MSQEIMPSSERGGKEGKRVSSSGGARAEVALTHSWTRDETSCSSWAEGDSTVKVRLAGISAELTGGSICNLAEGNAHTKLCQTGTPWGWKLLANILRGTDIFGMSWMEARRWAVFSQVDNPGNVVRASPFPVVRRIICNWKRPVVLLAVGARHRWVELVVLTWRAS